LTLFAPGYSGEQLDLAVNLSRLLFPIVLMLGITGLFAGVLNSFDHFGVPAIAPLFWNIAIIAAIIGLVPVFPEGKQIYAYAIGVLIGTLIQMLMPLPLVRSRLREFKFGRNFDPRNPLVKRVFVLMLPVTIGLGLINFDVTINNSVATLVGDGESAPAAIDFAFRVFMLPQGIFSVAIATVLFPTLARAATRLDMTGLRSSVGNGMRQMYLLLVPSAVVSAILAEPIIRLLFENGTKFQAEDTALVATALFWFAFSMPFQGSNLLLTRTFFALRRPWATTVLALGSLLVNLGLSLLLYKPYGVAGIVGATAVSTFGMTVAQAAVLRGPLNGIEATATITTFIKIAVASVPFGLVTYGLWYVLDDTLGRSTWGQIASLGPAFAAGAVTYGVTVYAMRIPEARQIFSLLSGRFRGSAA
jgi:putative peptidoglycan lipid II flippase